MFRRRSGRVNVRTLNVTAGYHGEEEENKSGPVAYDSDDWCQVIFQCFGSTWPKVIPYCILNVIFMIIVIYLKSEGIVDLGTTSQMHSLGGMIVSFLLVSRVNSALSGYGACRGDIEVMYRETRELIQDVMVVTNRRENKHDLKCKEWRHDIAYRSLILLRTSVAVVEFFSKELPGWECPELSGFEAVYATPCELWEKNSLSNDPGNNYTNTMRIPFRMAYLLRKAIAEQDEHLKVPVHVNHEIKMLNSVDSFMNGFYGMRKFITTPVPFPLVQMCRTIVIFYVFTIPLILLEMEGSKDFSAVWDCISVFFLTFGFMGLELVAIELDDPFGNDENDFDTLAFARMVFEDTYLLISETDGEDWAEKLRNRMGCKRLKDRQGFRSFGDIDEYETSEELNTISEESLLSRKEPRLS